MSDAAFALHRAPAPGLRRWLAERYPDNPFCTEAYAQAMCAGGRRVLVMLVVNDGRGEPFDGCYGFLRVGRLNLRRLEVPSTPACADSNAFWTGIRALGAKENIHELVLNSFDSAVFDPPDLAPLDVSLRERAEYVLDLSAGDLLGRFGSNHKRNIKRAQKLGFKIQETADPDAVLEHARLADLSTDRRTSRDSQEASGFATAVPRALLETGAATIYQVYDGDRLLSSILVLKSAGGAYYHSAGTDPQGMQQGASHFLIYRVAEALRANGFKRFNLGGVSPGQEGLRRFKTGFRPTEYQLHAAELRYSGKLRRELLSVAASLRSNPVTFVRSAFGRLDS